MLKILHTADWHLGQSFFGHDRTNEHAHFLNWLLSELKERETDVLIIAGDVFDVSNPSAAAQRMFYRFVSEATRKCPHLQIVAVAGNHDSASRLEAPIPLLEEMNTSIKGVVRKKDGAIDYKQFIVELKNSKGDVEALCMAVPFLRQGDYPHVETTGNPYAEGVKALYHTLTDYALSCRKPNQALIAVGHLHAIGAKIAEKDYSERTIIGGLEYVSPEAFPQEVAYTALGHIHKAQRVAGRHDVRYAGSPLPMSFAEKKYHHGVVEVHIENGAPTAINKVEYTPLVSLLSVPSEGYADPATALEQLEALPIPLDDAPQPYLEVKVILKEPEPMLRRQVEEAIADKQVRLARIVASYSASNEEQYEHIASVGLHDLNPLQILQTKFEQTYHSEMPQELIDLFQEVALSLQIDTPQ